MLKLRQISLALTVALMLCVTMIGSGAFAQSITHAATAGIQHTAQSATTSRHHQACNGYWHPGYWQDGYWQPGYWHSGYWQNGYWQPGFWQPGFWHPGYWHNGWCEWQGMGGMGR